MKKQKPKPKNIERNKRRNERKSAAIEFARAHKGSLVCCVCGTTEPIVFYGSHRNLKIETILNGDKPIRLMKRGLKNRPVLCLNHAELKRHEDKNSKRPD